MKQTAATLDETNRLFHSKWNVYQILIEQDILFHKKHFSTLEQILRAHYTNQPITFVDVGCGDASAIHATLLNNSAICHYIGIDSSTTLIAAAPTTLADVACQQEFVGKGMAEGITQLTNSSVDVIFCSFSLHHLVQAEKIAFLQHCRQKLKPSGCVVLADIMLAETDTRALWLARYETYLTTHVPGMPDSFYKEILDHVWAADYPEKISTFRHIAAQQQWQKLEVCFEAEDLFAFIALYK